jgi:hypothetical protein
LTTRSTSKNGWDNDPAELLTIQLSVVSGYQFDVYEHVLCDLQIDGRCLASPVEICRNHLVSCVEYNSPAMCHVWEDDVVLTRSPTHSTTVVPPDRRSALALNTNNHRALILIDGWARERGEEV